MPERLRLPLLLGAATFAWFLAIGIALPIDVDEGFYALAAELVTHGHLPYRHFFYPQAPLYPYLAAPIVGLFGARFVVLRVFSSLCAATTAGLVAHLVHRETRSRFATIVTVILFATHELAWQWLTTIRPYGPSAVTLLASFVLATPTNRAPRPRALVLAGALAASAPLMRLPLLPALGVVPLALWFRATRASPVRGALVLGLVILAANAGRHPALFAVLGSGAGIGVAMAGPGALAATKRVGWYALGAALFAGPIVALGARDWASFRYGLVGYHADSSSFLTFPQNRPYLAAAIGGGSILELSSNGMQNAFLIVAGIVGLVFRRRAIAMASLIGAAVLTCGASRHHPFIEHYMTPIVPYLAIPAGISLGRLERSWHRTRPNVRTEPSRIVVCAMATLFFVATSSSLEKKWLRGRHEGWDDRAFRPHTLDATAAAVASAVREHPGPLLPVWPGSALRAADAIMPGYENHFTRLVASKRTADASVLHLTSAEDLRRAITSHTPSVVVLDRETVRLPGDREGTEKLVTSAGYTLLETREGVGIYTRGR